MVSYYWLILMAVLIVVEIISLGLTTIWFAFGALVAYFVALAGGNLIVQIIVFLVVSIIALIFTRPIAVRFFNGKNREKTNADGLIGESARVIETIDNYHSTGRVIIRGQEWMARTENDDVINIDEKVNVLRISGVKLIVEHLGKGER